MQKINLKKRIRFLWFYTVFFVFVTFFHIGYIQAEEGEGDYNFYFGTFHAHHCGSMKGDDGGYSWDKKGKKYRSKENGAKKAFLTAIKNGGDFYAITPHTHRMKPAEYQELKDTAHEINKEYEGKFVAFYGQEWGKFQTGNHINIMNGDSLCMEIPSGRFDILYNEWLPSHREVAFVQFNHPHMGWSELDYGFDDYGSINELVVKSDVYVQSVAVIPGIRQSSRGYKKHSDAITFYYYTDFLNHGWHISPTADEDNHRDDWGGMVASKTVVIAQELTADSIYSAVREHRVYCTEDDEMLVTFKVAGDFGEKWMGQRIKIEDKGILGDLPPSDSSSSPSSSSLCPVRFIVIVDQKEGIDRDPVDEGDYEIRLYGDLDGKGGKRADVVYKTRVRRGERLEIPWQVEPGQYFFLHIMETAGKDNGGQNDDAYTTPIWFERG